jgi:hypothetical protein
MPGDIAKLHASTTESLSHTSPARQDQSNYRRDRTAPRPQSKPRVTFHKYITSFFGNAHHNRSAESETSRSLSRASSFRSNPRSSLHGSTPSIDFMSPAAFMFSGPALHRTSSVDDSTSHLPTPTSTGSERQPLSRTWTDSFSMLEEANILDEGLLEPSVEIGIVRTMSDVLLGIDTPSEESATALEHNLHHELPFDIHQSPRVTTARHFPSESVAYTLATLLLPHLDLAA